MCLSILNSETKPPKKDRTNFLNINRVPYLTKVSAVILQTLGMVAAAINTCNIIAIAIRVVDIDFTLNNNAGNTHNAAIQCRR